MKPEELGDLFVRGMVMAFLGVEMFDGRVGDLWILFAAIFLAYLVDSILWVRKIWRKMI